MVDIIGAEGRDPLAPEFLKKLQGGKNDSVDQAVADELRAKECKEHVKFDLEKFNCVIDPVIVMTPLLGLKFQGLNVVPLDTNEVVTEADKVRQKECMEHVAYNMKKYNCMIEPVVQLSPIKGVQLIDFNCIAMRIVKIPGVGR